MRFAVLLYQDESVWEHATPAEQEQTIREHEAFADAAARHGCRIEGGEALGTVSTATTVRRRGQAVSITEGPFAETTEQLGGFYLLDAPDLDAVTEAVRTLPEYSIEIRPVVDVP